MKGLKATNDKSSLNIPEMAKKTVNFIPMEGGFQVRPGSSKLTGLDVATYNSNMTPMESAVVDISGLQLILIVSEDGVLYGFIPERIGTLYRIARRYYDIIQPLVVGGGVGSVPQKSVKILQLNTFIYVLSDQLCWVIAGDGVEICDDKNDSTTPTIIVDAWDATIRDAENFYPRIYATNGWSSRIPEGEELYYRIRNEFGGVGSASKTIDVPKADSYVMAGVEGMNPYVMGVSARKKFIDDIYGFGIRTSTDAGDQAFYTVSFKNIPATTIGMVSNESTTYWGNVTNSGYVGNEVLITATSGKHALRLLSSYLASTDTTLVITQDGKAYLFIAYANRATFLARLGSGQTLLYAKDLICGERVVGTTSIKERLDGPFLIKLGTSFEATNLDITNRYDVGLILCIQTVVTNCSLVYSVEIEGMQKILPYLEGSNFAPYTGTIGGIQYTSVSVFRPSLAMDATPKFCDPVVFCRKFQATPVNNQVLCTYLHTTRDDQVWFASGENRTHTLSIKADIDSTGLYLKDINQTRDLLMILYYEWTEGDKRYLYDVALVGEETDLWVAGTKHNCVNNEGTPGAVHDWMNPTTEQFTTNPVLIHKVSLVANGYDRELVRNVGEWSDVAVFSGKFFFSYNSQLKITDPLLEWRSSATLQMDGDVLFMAPLEKRLMVFTTHGMFAIDAKLDVEPMSNVVAQFACTVANQVFFIDSQGVLYNTNFAQIPVTAIAQQTKNPYITVVSNSDIIKEKTDDWHIYDMVAFDKAVFISSNIGLFVYYLDTSLWWQLDYTTTIPSVFDLLVYRDRLLCLGGNYSNSVYFTNYDYASGGGS